MFAKERRLEILKILMDKKKVKVSDLSRNFNVSEVIIRKDLKLLEEEDQLERTHGGAILKKELVKNISLKDRKVSNIKGKMIIVDKIIDMLEDNEVIFLDSSSTNLLLAKKIVEKNKKVTVVTNMLDIMKELEEVEVVTLIGIGGVYNRQSGFFWGDSAINGILSINTQKLFLGGAGIDISRDNLSIFESNEVPVKKAMIESASKVFFLCEDSKFKTFGVYNFASLSDIDFLITDKKLDENLEKNLTDRGIQVI